MGGHGEEVLIPDNESLRVHLGYCYLNVLEQLKVLFMKYNESSKRHNSGVRWAIML